MDSIRPIISCWKRRTDDWRTSAAYAQRTGDLSISKFFEVMELLLENPNLNSSYLFRADILYDSSGKLQTPAEKELVCDSLAHSATKQGRDIQTAGSPVSTKLFEFFGHDNEITFPGYFLERKVIRRLIPRKPQVDCSLQQTCLILSSLHDSSRGPVLVAYLPHISDKNEIPWYHPQIRGLVYLYEQKDSDSRVSLYFLPIQEDYCTIPERLDRTLRSLLRTFVRLAKYDSHPTSADFDSEKFESNSGTRRLLTPAAIKDTILPQHIVQDTYSRLKQQYANHLINQWVEQTEPAKHVFEDLSIAAFLIELWKSMYSSDNFPGFVDVACGNGVLVYVLNKEGYRGFGFDARRRKTWGILEIEKHVSEQTCVPRPFLDALGSAIERRLPAGRVCDGIFPPETFIISNHADELTPWTPILSAVSCPKNPLPFLAIPCCSHNLSGARHRYQPSKQTDPVHKASSEESQPSSGDLKTLRGSKQEAANHSEDKSMYACLTRKIVALAEELGFEVELTLMRIPSTRNIGIVGNRRNVRWNRNRETDEIFDNSKSDLIGCEKERKMQLLIERECEMSGGVSAAAVTWVDRAKKLQMGPGRGKVNLGRQIDHV